MMRIDLRMEIFLRPQKLDISGMFDHKPIMRSIANICRCQGDTLAYTSPQHEQCPELMEHLFKNVVNCHVYYLYIIVFTSDTFTHCIYICSITGRS